MPHYPTTSHNPRNVLDEAPSCQSPRWPAYLSTYDEATHANQFSDTPQRPSLFPPQQGRFLSTGARGVKTQCSVISEAARSNRQALQASAPAPVGRLSPSKNTASHIEKMDTFGDAICSSIACLPPYACFRFDPAWSLRVLRGKRKAPALLLISSRRDCLTGPRTFSQSNKNPLLNQTQVQPERASVILQGKDFLFLCVFATHNRMTQKKDSKSAPFALLVALFAILIPDQLKGERRKKREFVDTRAPPRLIL